MTHARHISELRYERKMTLEKQYKQRAKMDILCHPYGFRFDYPSRNVNSIYFDTAVQSCYVGHTDGDFNREKIRLRWYGNLHETSVSLYIESKRRVGAMGQKDRYFAGMCDTKMLLDDEEFLMLFLANSELPEDIKMKLKCLKPVLTIRYLRDYFVSFDGRIRLTRDIDLKMINYTGCAVEPSAYAISSGAVLELKYDASCDNVARRVANGFKFAVCGFSKYVTAIEKLGDMRLA